MIEINLWLYGKPSWNMEIEGKNFIEPALLKNHGVALKDHLERTAELLHILQKSGWKIAESYGAIYELTLYKNTNMIKAEKEILSLGIDPAELKIEQVED